MIENSFAKWMIKSCRRASLLVVPAAIRSAGRALNNSVALGIGTVCAIWFLLKASFHINQLATNSYLAFLTYLKIGGFQFVCMLFDILPTDFDNSFI